MEIEDIARKKIGHHIGYMPQYICFSGWTLKGIIEAGFLRLLRVPRKISAYYKRALIKNVYKSNCYKNPLDDYYLIESTDGTIFEVQY